jgi:hypothetical protein
MWLLAQLQEALNEYFDQHEYAMWGMGRRPAVQSVRHQDRWTEFVCGYSLAQVFNQNLETGCSQKKMKSATVGAY